MTPQRNLRRDSRLQSRMVMTMLLLGLVYGFFLWFLTSVAGATLMLVIAAGLVLVQFFLSDKLVLMSMKATVVSPEEAPEAVHRITELPGLSVRGLMTMAPFTDRESVLRDAFRALRRLHEKLGSLEGYRGQHLSMGMTNDFRVAVEEGSTMIRIGTALLGPRPQAPARRARAGA